MAAELNRLAKKAKGRITPRDVVEAARSASSPLHGYFEWNDSEAAERYREIQARTLLRSISFRVTTVTERFNVPAYMRNPEAAPSEQGYIQTMRLKNDEDLAREALLEEFGRVAANLRRARAFAKYFDMVEDVDVMLGQVNLMRTRVIDHPETRPAG